CHASQSCNLVSFFSVGARSLQDRLPIAGNLSARTAVGVAECRIPTARTLRRIHPRAIRIDEPTTGLHLRASLRALPHIRRFLRGNILIQPEKVLWVPL